MPPTVPRRRRPGQDNRLGVRLAVRVQPRASRNEVVGRQGEAWKVRLTAPPVDGRANEALCDFLAERLGVKRASVTVVQGFTGRNKIVEVPELSAAELARRLGAA
jgi:uncharacterized protein (TIGR00251 family)